MIFEYQNYLNNLNFRAKNYQNSTILIFLFFNKIMIFGAKIQIIKVI